MAADSCMQGKSWSASSQRNTRHSHKTAPGGQSREGGQSQCQCQQGQSQCKSSAKEEAKGQGANPKGQRHIAASHSCKAASPRKQRAGSPQNSRGVAPANTPEALPSQGKIYCKIANFNLCKGCTNAHYGQEGCKCNKANSCQGFKAFSACQCTPVATTKAPTPTQATTASSCNATKATSCHAPKATSCKATNATTSMRATTQQAAPSTTQQAAPHPSQAPTTTNQGNWQSNAAASPPAGAGVSAAMECSCLPAGRVMKVTKSEQAYIYRISTYIGSVL